MASKGDVFINPVTGERAVVRVNPTAANDDLLVADLYIRPGGAVVGEHVHPEIEERFTVIRGHVGFTINGVKDVAAAGRRLVVPAGTAHDWWNAGTEEALVRVEIDPGARFQAMIMNLFGLAQDGKTDRRGLPNILQLALIAREFSDVVYFTKPPRVVQRLLFGGLAALGRARGYRGSYPHYLNRAPAEIVELEEYEVAR